MTASADGGMPVEELVRLLDAADRDRRSIAGPLQLRDVQHGYDVQRRVGDLRSARLASPPAAWKVALTSEATQRALGTHEPASGRLLGVDVLLSGSEISPRRLLEPLVEVELVFRVVEALPPGADLDQVLARTEVAGGLECPDSRFSAWFGGSGPALPLATVVADNCLAGALVVGDVWVPATRLRLDEVAARLTLGGKVLADGSGSAVLGHPARAVVWLSDHLRTQGTQLRPFDLVSSGTLTPPLRLQVGVAEAEFSHGLGSVKVIRLAGPDSSADVSPLLPSVISVGET